MPPNDNRNLVLFGLNAQSEMFHDAFQNLGYKVLSEMFAGLVAKGFALDFSLIRKNVFFFHRVA